ncbi:MAG: endolytic transglycosylase MltG [Proteobacteria bacterium]|nr:endolytic transglycosylase MltG [Pseudomonadota bacterium]
MNRPKPKTLGIALAAILLTGVGVLSLLAYQVRHFLETPFPAQTKPIIFNIDPGQNLGRIADNLKKEGLITHPALFKLYVRYKKAATGLRAGEYEFTAPATPIQILDQFLAGRVKLYRLTIPEGLNMEEISRLVQERLHCDELTFLALCHDPAFIKTLKVDSHSLEGYLFPDTYFFPKKTTCRHIIQKMVDTFHRVYTPEWKARTKEMGFSVHEIVTLASIIEKETGDASERPLISSVFHNRLGKNMRLESDPTVIYGDRDFDGRIRRRHLQRITPYNTYQIQGLPQGPIANPGSLSLGAALYPAKSEYLFFVSKNDTTHFFSKTFAEHSKAVIKYQLNK